MSKEFYEYSTFDVDTIAFAIRQLLSELSDEKFKVGKYKYQINSYSELCRAIFSEYPREPDYSEIISFTMITPTSVKLNEVLSCDEEIDGSVIILGNADDTNRHTFYKDKYFRINNLFMDLYQNNVFLKNYFRIPTISFDMKCMIKDFIDYLISKKKLMGKYDLSKEEIKGLLDLYLSCKKKEGSKMEWKDKIQKLDNDRLELLEKRDNLLLDVQGLNDEAHKKTVEIAQISTKVRQCATFDSLDIIPIINELIARVAFLLGEPAVCLSADYLDEPICLYDPNYEIDIDMPSPYDKVVSNFINSVVSERYNELGLPIKYLSNEELWCLLDDYVQNDLENDVRKHNVKRR